MKALLPCILTALLALGSCSGGDKEPTAADTDSARDIELAELSEILRPNSPLKNPYDWHLDTMPSGGRKMHINYLGGTLGRVFNDSNYLHLEAARALGISPVDTPAKAWHASRPLVKIESNPDFVVDNLTHSMPYLVPEAAQLLHDIGRSFNDSLEARGGGAYKLKVTSVLRTPTTVKSLRRHNRNAVETSTHLFGTTFDISYAQFMCLNDSMPRTQEDLKNLLGEVLNDLKRRGRCYIKYERKQACFHITARPG
ncbi:MAG: hypothetical protein HDS52_05200 [Barnesiella sp.]|nr:hypothetical protein [Barnesiella sp.]